MLRTGAYTFTEEFGYRFIGKQNYYIIALLEFELARDSMNDQLLTIVQRDMNWFTSMPEDSYVRAELPPLLDHGFYSQCTPAVRPE